MPHEQQGASMSQLIPSVVTPAIYKFEFPEDSSHPKASKWGWHRASELYSAINNLLGKEWEDVLSAREIAAKFAHLSPLRESGQFLVVDGEGKAWLVKTGPHEWLEAVMDRNGYLPAKVGTRLLNEIKHPTIGVVRRALSS